MAFINTRLAKMLEQIVVKGDEIKQIQDAVNKTDEAIVQMKRKNAGGDVRKKLLEAAAQEQQQFSAPQAFMPGNMV